MSYSIFRGRWKVGGSQNEPRRAMSRTFSTGTGRRAPGLSQGSREPWGCWDGGSVSRWELCCVCGWRGRRCRVGPKGYFLFVFFLLVSKTAAPSLPPPASCAEHGPVWGPHPQPLCWVIGSHARCTPPQGKEDTEGERKV